MIMSIVSSSVSKLDISFHRLQFAQDLFLFIPRFRDFPKVSFNRWNPRNCRGSAHC